MERLPSLQSADSLVLASGDADFEPVITKACNYTQNIEIWSFRDGKIERVGEVA